MKNLIILLSALCLLTFSSCKKECKLGYAGSNCKDELVRSFFGKYEGVVVSGNTSTAGYFEVGTVSSSATDISIGMFKASLEDNNGNFYIPTQTVSINGFAYTAYGSATFTGTTLDLKVTTERPGFFQAIYFTGIKTD